MNFQEQAYPTQTYPQVEKKTDVYDQHRTAVLEWQESCRAFQAASARRDQAKAAMEKATQVMAEALQSAMCDPTVPQPVGAQNGSGIGGMLRQY
jgi:hypothetical protein